MKTYKPTSVLSLTIASMLLLGAVIPAPEANAARQPADAPSAAQTNDVAAGQTQAEATDTNATNETTNQAPPEAESSQQPLVVFFKDVDLKAGESAESGVVIFGSATIHGKVHDRSEEHTSELQSLR